MERSTIWLFSVATAEVAAWPNRQGFSSLRCGTHTALLPILFIEAFFLLCQLAPMLREFPIGPPHRSVLDTRFKVFTLARPPAVFTGSFLHDFRTMHHTPRFRQSRTFGYELLRSFWSDQVQATNGRLNLITWNLPSRPTVPLSSGSRAPSGRPNVGGNK
jgi:hypothetical protein